MEAATDELAFSLKNALQIELIKLPPQLRKMTMKEFMSSSQTMPITTRKDMLTAWSIQRTGARPAVAGILF
jgi:hypothetical protein